MCKARAEERWHIIIDCPVVKALWTQLSDSFIQFLVDEPVTRVEMSFGLRANTNAVKLRNRLGYTLRSAIHSLRAERFINEREARNRIWSLFLYRLKRDIAEDYQTAKLNGNLESFERRVLIRGLIGTLSRVRGLIWGGLLQNVGLHYYHLFG